MQLALYQDFVFFRPNFFHKLRLKPAQISQNFLSHFFCGHLSPPRLKATTFSQLSTISCVLRHGPRCLTLTGHPQEVQRCGRARTGGRGRERSRAPLLFICPRSAAMPRPSSATEGIQEAITGDPISRSSPARTESKHAIFRKFARPESRPSGPKFRRYFLENRLRPNLRKTFAKSLLAILST